MSSKDFLFRFGLMILFNPACCWHLFFELKGHKINRCAPPDVSFRDLVGTHSPEPTTTTNGEKEKKRNGKRMRNNLESIEKHPFLICTCKLLSRVICIRYVIDRACHRRRSFVRFGSIRLSDVSGSISVPFKVAF